MRIGLLTSSNLLPDASDTRGDVFEFTEELGSLKPAFASLGLSIEPVLWDSCADVAADFDAFLPLMVWDYFEGNEARFLALMEKAAKTTLVLNTPERLRWNADKGYLDELAARGAPVIPTIKLTCVSEAAARGAFAEFGTDKIVIKPQVGGGAWRQVLLGQNDPWPSADLLPPEGTLIQPFLPNVKEEGEYSFLYFGGQYSHGLVKRAKPGDYRIQSLYGGTEERYDPSEAERAVAQSVLDTLDSPPLYARVDLLRGPDGQLKLIELEMIEPYLYLPHADVIDGINQGALALGRALKDRL